MQLVKSILIMALISIVSLSMAAIEVKILPQPAEQDIVRESGTIHIPDKTRVKILDLVPAGGFKEDKLYEFSIRFENLNAAFLTGKEFESVSKQRDGTIVTNTLSEQVVFTPLFNRNAQEWHGIRAAETSTKKTVWVDSRFPGGPSTINLNYIMPEQTFATIDNVARWQEREAAVLKRDLLKEDVRLGIEITESELRFFINGVYVRHLLREGSGIDDYVLRIQRSAVMSDTANVRDLHKHFRTIDISERLNAGGFPGAGGKLKDMPAGGEIEVHGVPFLVPNDRRYDHVDLAMSWADAAMRCGYYPTLESVRWRAASDKAPLRYQFRAPFDNYDALYVLAASDDRNNTIPRFTAQFYQPRRGRPVNFESTDIPSFTAEGRVENAFPVTLGNGKEANLYLVKVKLEPGQFKKFSNRPFFEMELTKEVQPYRTYPDPIHHSIHAAGLPSSVRVFGITFRRSSLKTTFDPDALGNVWFDGETASYTVKTENITKDSLKANFSFKASSYDRTDTYTENQSVQVGPGETKEIKFKFRPKRFGHYDVTMVQEDSGETKTFPRTLAYLRKRDHGPRGFYDKGMFYGCWNIYSAEEAKLAAMMGLDSYDRLRPADDKARETMERYGMRGYLDGHTLRAHGVIKADKTDEENMAALMESLPALFQEPSAIHEPVYSPILCEPGGIGTGHAGFGEYYGEDPYDYSKLTGRAKERYELYKKLFLMVRKGILQVSPNTKIMLPNGSWTFTIPFLQNPETRDLFDGVKMDYQYYQRLPEQQMHQCSIHSMFYFWNAWNKYRKTPPVLSLGEGPGISQIYPGANDAETAAALQIRATIIMAGYGVQHQHSISYTLQDKGENHCSGGFLDDAITLNPHLSYSAFAAFSRHTRHAMFESYANLGSFSAYCANFRDSKSGKFFRAIWTIRGTREFIFDTAPDKLEVYDFMDNLVKPEARGGKSVVRAGQIPIYVYGTDENTAVTLGALDHGDSRFGSLVKKIGNAADLFTEQTDDEDSQYRDFHPEQIRRFRAEMEIGTEDVDAAFGGKALSITLPEQDIDRGVMPYFTCLKLEKPVKIEGKGSHILIWAKANSDWGRIVYVMSDAQGKMWYSVGYRGSWNVDDMPGDSVFCFDGWRLLRYELPANAPWDSFRELGLTRWGSDKMNDIVELPLSLEKVFIERRSSVMYGNGLHKIEQEQPVLLGDIYVEYAQESDMTDEVIRLSKIRAPQIPAGALPNPIAEMKKTGTLPAGRITGVKDPDTWFDGTRGVFSFEMPEDAVSADIWMSLYPDGKGALRQGKDLKQSPAQVSGFIADTEFHAFLVYKDKEGKTSVPSEPFKFKMEDHFQHQ